LGCTELNSKATIGMTNRILLITEKINFSVKGQVCPKYQSCSIENSVIL
jgi:hypothetical protein